MSEVKTCPRCGFAWSLETPEGLCPRCLLGAAMEAPAANAEAPSLGAHVSYFGDYELRREVARGGMGVVYEAVQASLGRTVALKMILAGRFASEADVERFHVEAEAAANLDHPAIVPIHEVGVFQGQHYFSMAFVDGESLAERLARGPLPSREAAALVAEVADAVAYAHGRGVVHRDLKPANVLLTPEGRPRITDFGLAKQLESERDLTGTGQTLGTPGYMAPEQVMARRGEVREAADVYGLGALLYACSTGRAPFDDENPARVLVQVAEEPPRSPRTGNHDVPRDLETICLACLEKDPARRYASAQDVADELRRFLEGRPIAARPLGLGGRLVRWGRRRPVEGTLGAALLVVVLALCVVAFFYRQDLLPVTYGKVEYLVDVRDGHPRLSFGETIVVFEGVDLPGRFEEATIEGAFLLRGGYVHELGMTAAGGVSSTTSTWGPQLSEHASGISKVVLNDHEFFLSQHGSQLLFEVEGEILAFRIGETEGPTRIAVGRDGVPRLAPRDG